MGNTCKPMAVSFHCMTKFTTIKKKESEKKNPHTYGIWEDANNDSICKAAKEMQILKKNQQQQQQQQHQRQQQTFEFCG